MVLFLFSYTVRRRKGRTDTKEYHNDGPLIVDRTSTLQWNQVWVAAVAREKQSKTKKQGFETKSVWQNNTAVKGQRKLSWKSVRANTRTFAFINHLKHSDAWYRCVYFSLSFSVVWSKRFIIIFFKCICVFLFVYSFLYFYFSCILFFFVCFFNRSVCIIPRLHLRGFEEHRSSCRSP